MLQYDVESTIVYIILERNIREPTLAVPVSAGGYAHWEPEGYMASKVYALSESCAEPNLLLTQFPSWRTT
jgi:hypothetical protein